MIGNGSGAVMITPEGGLAVWVVNNTGAPSFKGAILRASESVENAVDLLPIDAANPMSIAYDDGVPNGELMRVVFSGKAEVFYVGSTVLDYLARMTVAGDSGAATGKGIAEAGPNPPFSTDKHFMEVGHVMESRTGAGLALTIIHFN